MDTQKEGEFNPKFRKEVKRDETATMANAGFSWDAGSSNGAGNRDLCISSTNTCSLVY
jgi:hypothetical protein